MNIEGVIERLRVGGKISRKAWVDGSYVQIHIAKGLNTRIGLYIPNWLEPLDWEITQEDLMHDDWFAIDDR